MNHNICNTETIIPIFINPYIREELTWSNNTLLEQIGP